MKKVLILLSLPLLLCYSCEKIDMANDIEDDSEQIAYDDAATKNINIITRSSDGAVLSYPISIYAFDSKGNCKAEATITSSASTSTKLTLPAGSYHITALSLPSTYPTISKVTDSNANITMPTNGYATTPLMLGAANVNVSSTNQTANIVLGYRQASVNITLNDVPSNVSSISVSIGTPYKTMTLAGNLSNDGVVTIPCTKASDKWTTGTFYIMPTKGNQTVLTISLKTNTDSETSYSYTYNSALNAGTPYVFKGSYSTSTDSTPDITVNTTISAGEWTSTVNDDFNFGPGALNGNSGGNSEDSPTPSTENDTYIVSSFPEDGDTWNGHVVATAEISDDKCEVMLISLKGWGDVYSSFHATESGMAQGYADSYTEKGISDWNIPTTDDAKLIASIYSTDENLAILNSKLTDCGGSIIYKVLENKNARFLCDGGAKTYSFANTTISAAGATVKYSLRLVKHIILKKQ